LYFEEREWPGTLKGGGNLHPGDSSRAITIESGGKTQCFRRRLIILLLISTNPGTRKVGMFLVVCHGTIGKDLLIL